MDVKVCGLCRAGDAALVAGSGATHAGVIRVPGTPRTESRATARMVLDAAVGLRRVGVFADASPAEILQEADALALDVVQLHGDEAPEDLAPLAAAGLEVWKVIRPVDGPGLLEAAARWGRADLLLVEGSSPRGLGGVGAAFDWRVLEEVRDRLPAGCRIGVAGGLEPGNVGDAVRRLRPDLVDVSSGVEAAPGEKDGARVREFVARAREAATTGRRA